MSKVYEPATPQAKETYNGLLRSAEEIFEERGFFRTSVAEICRSAQVANGTFYRYFSDKDDIFISLAKRLSDQLTEEMKAPFLEQGVPFYERFKRSLAGYFSFLQHNSSVYQIFRQVEFVDRDFHQAFYASLTETIGSAIEEGVEGDFFRNYEPRVAASFVLGVLSFVSMKWIIWESSSVNDETLEDLLDFLIRGIDRPGPPIDIGQIPSPPPLTSGLYPESGSFKKGSDRTESRLLSAAEQCFGRNGFYGTAVGDITRQAEVAQGTFYNYFSSKVDAFKKLVREINKLWRWEARRAIEDLEDRRATEYQGFRVFFSFIAKHPHLYRIVREAEFVDKPTGQWYYRRFAKGYQKRLNKAMERGEIRRVSPQLLTYSLMGIGHFLGQKWFVREDREEIPASEFRQIFDLILRGLGTNDEGS